MAVTSFAFASNIFGFLLGSLSLILLVVGIFHLPSKKIKALEISLREAHDDLVSAIEERLLSVLDQDRFSSRFMKLREESSILRERAYSATTFYKDFREFFRGLSWEIRHQCDEVRDLRAAIITASEKERRQMWRNAGSHALTNPRRASTQIHSPFGHRSTAAYAILSPCDRAYDNNATQLNSPRSGDNHTSDEHPTSPLHSAGRKLLSVIPQRLLSPLISASDTLCNVTPYVNDAWKSIFSPPALRTSQPDTMSPVQAPLGDLEGPSGSLHQPGVRGDMF